MIHERFRWLNTAGRQYTLADLRGRIGIPDVHQQDWGVPVRLVEGGADRLPLVLAGMDDQTP